MPFNTAAQIMLVFWRRPEPRKSVSRRCSGFVAVAATNDSPELCPNGVPDQRGANIDDAQPKQSSCDRGQQCETGGIQFFTSEHRPAVASMTDETCQSVKGLSSAFSSCCFLGWLQD